MSVIRPRPPDDPVHFEPLGILSAAGIPADTRPDAPTGPSAGRDGLRTSLQSAAAVVLPERLLHDYTTPGRRSTSGLAAILATARRLRETVDRVIVVGDGCAALAGRAVFDSCAHPFHNELPRGERGGRPRLSWIDSSADNDLIQGLLDLVAPAGSAAGRDLLGQWAVVATGPAARGDRTAGAVRLFVEPLVAAVGGDRVHAAGRLVTIAAPDSPLARLATELGGRVTCELPSEPGAESAPFTAATLLPAAVAGIDIVRLLEGAVAMNRRFVEAPPDVNPVLRFAAVSLAAAEVGRDLVLTPAGRQLESVGLWHARLQELLPPAPRADRARSAASPLAAGGRAIRLPLNVAQPIRDRLVVTPQPATAAAGREAAPAGENWCDPAAGSRPANPDGLLLPRSDEHAVGQLLQLIQLATLAAAWSP